MNNYRELVGRLNNSQETDCLNAADAIVSLSMRVEELERKVSIARETAIEEAIQEIGLLPTKSLAERFATLAAQVAVRALKSEAA